jgi:hypothetical protein
MEGSAAARSQALLVATLGHHALADSLLAIWPKRKSTRDGLAAPAKERLQTEVVQRGVLGSRFGLGEAEVLEVARLELDRWRRPTSVGAQL